jgi:glutathione S-transferase
VPLAKRIAPATTLPILIADREVIQGSGRILDWADLPGGDVGLEERFDRRIGLLVRQYIYAATLSESASGVRAALLDGVSATQARLARLMWPATRRLMIAGMNARPALVSQIEEQLAGELDWFDHRLDGRRHLVGDRLGRADITAASLLGPLARPAACPLYSSIVLPARVEETLARWRRRPSLAWTERLYSDHRR